MKFHISDVLSITTGRLVSLDHIDGVYRVCDGMTGVENMTHQLPRVSRQITPVILQQHPELAEVVVPEIKAETSEEARLQIVTWLETVVYPRFGTEVELEPLASYDAPNPLLELIEMRQGKPVIVVATGA